MAVLAHEYYGHYKFSPSEFKSGDWRDEMRASYIAALKAPNLSDKDRAYLILDAYERAKEAGRFFIIWLCRRALNGKTNNSRRANTEGIIMFEFDALNLLPYKLDFFGDLKPSQGTWEGGGNEEPPETNGGKREKNQKFTFYNKKCEAGKP
jgi:hypothetical protein